MHAAGAGVPPSRVKQIELLGTACTLGDALACAVPAKAFASGNGVARDERRAVELWQRACAGGVESACESLGEPK
jgi:TPR repeat protein